MNMNLAKDLLRLLLKYLFGLFIYIFIIWWTLSKINLFICHWYIMIIYSLGISLFIEIILVIIAFIVVKLDELHKNI